MTFKDGWKERSKELGAEIWERDKNNLTHEKQKKNGLVERREHGYYRSKNTHQATYAKIFKVYEPYISRDNLEMLKHKWSTHKNEAINKRITSYTPKDKTYCTTTSLVTRVEMTGAVQIEGYHRFWDRVYVKNGLDLDKSLYNQLLDFDEKKQKQNERAATREGELRRGRKRVKKTQQGTKIRHESTQGQPPVSTRSCVETSNKGHNRGVHTHKAKSSRNTKKRTQM